MKFVDVCETMFGDFLSSRMQILAVWQALLPTN